MNMKHLAAGFTLATLLGTAAHAATITETFTFTGLGPNNHYTYTHTSLDVVGSEGSTVTVTAATYPTLSTDAVTGPGNVVARGHSWGLGAFNSSHDSDHRVDGYGANDALLFSFDTVVNLLSVSFGSFHGSFDAFGNVSPVSEVCCNALSSTVDLSSKGISGDLLGLGAYFSNSSFKVRSFTVSYDMPTGGPTPVPLPAAGWMLLAGLGGLAAMNRRKKAA